MDYQMSYSMVLEELVTSYGGLYHAHQFNKKIGLKVLTYQAGLQRKKGTTQLRGALNKEEGRLLHQVGFDSIWMELLAKTRKLVVEV